MFRSTVSTTALQRLALGVVLLLLVPLAGAAPIRFLLTFDDGPSLWSSQPTARILAQLADNPVTPGAKAIFFVQTEHESHGGSVEGEALIRAECWAGHRVGVHAGTARGHIPHTALPTDELVQSLQIGRAHLQALCGEVSSLIRPPDWRFDDRTTAAYRSLGMAMLLADVRAFDGKIYGWYASLRRRSNINTDLERVRDAIAAGRMPEVDGVIPVVVGFHDTNPYTASHMTEYLQILVEEAANVGLPLADPPFYTDGHAVEHAARVRGERDSYARTKWPKPWFQ
ncbi:polysaccharide deacetylase family protein [Jeongeupia naejangsanensis]|uniref:Polysaccharide deacetylase family protein n=1 Tax=Jeongeupia naejangsanensis TaxID=613195 RepID=A0ABS2BND1_9NEIS|nr:polysaccharide deacetylase family protein [Jeongeupia naejangsanensis]MBM3117121.1 polysaccharide deacetylase family protein [Jeongeupia naejangsanensis]